MELEFTIPGKMRGKGRPRFVRHPSKKFPMAIPDEDTTIMESVVRDFAHQAMGSERRLLQGPLSLDVVMVLVPAASWSKKRIASAFWASGRPDLDNVVKLIGDSLNKHIFTDDSQFAKVTIERTYRIGEQERTTIRIVELTPPADTLL